jgi:hypothetical protein
MFRMQVYKLKWNAILMDCCKVSGQGEIPRQLTGSGELDWPPDIRASR